MTLSALATVGAWLAAVARIPFVAGIDHFLPASFGRPHPRWGSPHVALLVQSGICALFIVLGQAGTSVQGAYEVLVSMTVLATFIPFLFIFAAAFRVQGWPSAAAQGRPLITALSIVGFLATATSIVLSVFPAPDEPNKALAVMKVVGLNLAMTGVGVVIYVIGKRNLARAA
jgi:amino acid transporter